MFAFSLAGFGIDSESAELALGIISSSTFEDSPKCLFGIAIDKNFNISVDLFWIPIL